MFVQWWSWNLVVCKPSQFVKLCRRLAIVERFFILVVRRAFAWFNSPSFLCILFDGSITTKSSRTSSTKNAHFSPFLLISKSFVCSRLYLTRLIYAWYDRKWQLKPHALFVIKWNVAYLGFQIASKIRTKKIKVITIL